MTLLNQNNISNKNDDYLDKPVKNHKWKGRVWTTKKISFVSLLVSTSVVFILMFTRILPITAFPSLKIMAGGIPIKLTGYIFGPFIGGITGLLSEVLSFMMVPIFFNVWYLLAFTLAGVIPGFVGVFANRMWKNRKEVAESFKVKVNNVNFFATLIILSMAVGTIVYLTLNISDETFKDSQLITSKWTFLVIAGSGTATMIVGVIFFRFKMKPETFNAILPIIMFSALLEFANTPITTLGDVSSLTGGDSQSFIDILATHLLMSPVKIWGNMIFILVAYKIVSPLIFNKTDNSWSE